jgi:hypothetical protein
MHACYGAPRSCAASSHHCSRQLAQGRLLCATLRRAACAHTGRTAGTAVRAQNGGSSYEVSTSSAARDEDGSSVAATVATAAATAKATPGAPPFDWLRAWYAVGLVDALAPDVPTALSVVGVPLALWRDGAGAWCAVRDACPHRLAPLSEGRVAEDGTLQARACAMRSWSGGAGSAS